MEAALEEYLDDPCCDKTLMSPEGEGPEPGEPCMAGIDEAGRGPVLGPMAYAVAYFPISASGAMKKMAFADSKTLTEEKREAIFEKMGTDDCSSLGWICKLLSPTTISNSMLKRSKYNLNALSHDTAIYLTREAINRGVNITELYVDTVGPPEKYQAKLQAVFPGVKITVKSKADSLYHVVSAASICAKVLRDRVIKRWKFKEHLEERESLELGSGYPGDPQTKAFLRQNLDPIFGFPSLVRFSWSTITNLLKEKAVDCTWDDDEDGDESNSEVGSKSILEFFEKKDKMVVKSKSKKERVHPFFSGRVLSKISNLSELI